jgi:ketosteroid isomerase-like protein
LEGEEAVNLVTHFLRRMEARDLDGAERLMAPGAKIIFPGGKQFSSQREMVEASSDRYQWVKKKFEQIDAHHEGDAGIVYVIGTLYGVNQQGVSFSNVRFIDRFVLRNGLIYQQDVWNDLAESGVLKRID